MIENEIIQDFRLLMRSFCAHKKNISHISEYLSNIGPYFRSMYENEIELVLANKEVKLKLEGTTIDRYFLGDDDAG